MFSVLVVEDTPAFGALYARAVERLGGAPVRAESYETSVQAVERRQFAVAIVDVRLSEGDESNIDGLRVLEYLRSRGEPTKVVLITGFGTYQVARDALKKYEAFDALEKTEDLDAIEASIRNASAAFRQTKEVDRIALSRTMAWQSMEVWEWEDNVLRVCSPRGGAEGLYRFLTEFTKDLLPLLRDPKRPGCQVNKEQGIVEGLFWSRGMGLPVLLRFGSSTRYVEADLAPLEPSALGLGTPALTTAIRKTEGSNLSGTVWLADAVDFAAFARIANA